MDVRLSFEQRALRDSVAHAVDRAGPKTVADLDDQERAAKLDAAIDAAGWRELRAAADGPGPLASAVEAALVAEELARGLADAPFLGSTLAAELRRRAGAAPATAPEVVLFAPDLSGPATTGDAGPSLASVAVDARNAATALALAPGPGGARAVTVPIGVTAPRTDRAPAR
jgi:hypothetical protein